MYLYVIKISPTVMLLSNNVIQLLPIAKFVLTLKGYGK